MTAPVLAEIDYTIIGEAITPNLYRHYLFDGLLMVITMKDFGRATTNAWFDIVAEHIKASTPSRPFLCVHDFNNAKVALTPYNGKKSIELYMLLRQQKGFNGRAAYVLPTSPTGQLIKLFIRGYGISSFQEQTPSSRKAGIDWCAQGVPAQASKPASTEDTPKN
jgi:hypothetical protein